MCAHCKFTWIDTFLLQCISLSFPRVRGHVLLCFMSLELVYSSKVLLVGSTSTCVWQTHHFASGP